MNIIAVLLICIVLFSIFLQDWKFRKIHILLPIILFTVSYLGVILLDHKTKIKFVLINIAFFLVIFLVLVLYMSNKNKKIINPFQNYFGLGDLLFYLSISPLFLLKNYIVFFIVSMLFSIVLELLILRKKSQKSIPLAGFSGLLLLLIICFESLFHSYKLTLL